MASLSSKCDMIHVSPKASINVGPAQLLLQLQDEPITGDVSALIYFGVIPEIAALEKDVCQCILGDVKDGEFVRDAPASHGIAQPRSIGYGKEFAYNSQHFPEREMPRPIKAVKDLVERRTGSEFDVILCKIYLHNEVALAKHQDVDKLAQVVAVVTYGCSRRLVFKSLVDRRETQFLPESGSLWTMRGLVNEHYQHGVAQSDDMPFHDEVRISLTFRQTTLINTPVSPNNRAIDAETYQGMYWAVNRPLQLANAQAMAMVPSQGIIAERVRQRYHSQRQLNKEIRRQVARRLKVDSMDHGIESANPSIQQLLRDYADRPKCVRVINQELQKLQKRSADLPAENTPSAKRRKLCR